MSTNADEPLPHFEVSGDVDDANGAVFNGDIEDGATDEDLSPTAGAPGQARQFRSGMAAHSGAPRNQGHLQPDTSDPVIDSRRGSFSDIKMPRGFRELRPMQKFRAAALSIMFFRMVSWTRPNLTVLPSSLTKHSIYLLPFGNPMIFALNVPLWS